MILAIDSSGAVTVMGSGTSRSPGVSLRAEGARRHAEAIDLLFAEQFAESASTIDAIAVGIGPGPYSGLRVGIAFAVGLGRALEVPVLGVCSLDAKAWQVVADGDLEEGTSFAVGADARRGEIYWAQYQCLGEPGVERIAGPMVIPASQAAASDIPVHDVEIDAARLASTVARLSDAGSIPVDPNPELVPHGHDATSTHLPAGPLFTPRPLYLRQPDVTVAPSSGIAP